MIKCGICGFETKTNESFESHTHIPDFYLDVWNGKYCLKRIIHYNDGTSTEEILPFNLPKDITEWVMDTCGGSINRSGIYRLPGLVWEWVIAMLRNEISIAQFLEKEIRTRINKN